MKPPAVAVESIVALQPPSLRCVIHGWADSNGHMNMRWYVALFDDAGDELHERMGLTPEFHKQHNTGTVDLEHHTHFLSEVMPGDTVAVYARLVSRSAKRVHYLMFLVNESKNKPAAIFECINGLLDRSARKTTPFPPQIAEKIDAWLGRDTKLDWQPPISGVMNA